MITSVTRRLCLHLNYRTPWVSLFYIHVNMAKAERSHSSTLFCLQGQITQISVEQQKAEPYREGVLALMRRGGGLAQSL